MSSFPIWFWCPFMCSISFWCPFRRIISTWSLIVLFEFLYCSFAFIWPLGSVSAGAWPCSYWGPFPTCSCWTGKGGPGAHTASEARAFIYCLAQRWFSSTTFLSIILTTVSTFTNSVPGFSARSTCHASRPSAPCIPSTTCLNRWLRSIWLRPIWLRPIWARPRTIILPKLINSIQIDIIWNSFFPIKYE